jgi:hypothetical protein
MDPVPVLPLRAKGAGHDAYTDKVRRDWLLVIKSHPDRFDAMLHRPVIAVPSPDDINQAKFERLNERVDDLSYADPVLVSVVESSGDDEGFTSSYSGDESLGFGETATMLIRISEFEVPEGSIIEFLVSLAGGELQRQFWYVHRSVAIGSPAIGVIHYCIPCGDVEQSTLPDLTVQPVPVEPPISEVAPVVPIAVELDPVVSPPESELTKPLFTPR